MQKISVMSKNEVEQKKRDFSPELIGWVMETMDLASSGRAVLIRIHS